MTLNLEIIKLNENYLEKLYELEKLCFSDPWNFSSLQSELNNNYFFILLENSNLAGYTCMHKVLDEGNLARLAVHPERRRLNFARKLLHFLFNISKKENLKFLTLEARISNFSAINLYSTEGFQIIGYRKDFYSNPKETAIIMRKFL